MLANKNYIGLFFIVALATYFWSPALFDGKTLIHGETAHFGLPMMGMESSIFEKNNDILWSDKLSGGHPLHAEGQGAFANPIRHFISQIFEPIYAYNLYHWFNMVASGLGLFLLARFLGLSLYSSMFSSLASVFSIIWISFHANMATVGTLTWVPWLILAGEYWFKHTSLKSSVLLAVPAFFLVVSGYPHLAHGAVLYMLLSFLPSMLSKEGRQSLSGKWSKLLLTGGLAVLFAVGLSAIQLLPLIELIEQSHRSDGITLAYPSWPALHIKGLLFVNLTNVGLDSDALNVANLGSMMVFSVTLIVLLVKRPARINGHLLAAFVLYNLGMQQASPLFDIIYEYRLIPGLHYFRSMHPYYSVAIIGITLCAGFALDGLSRYKVSSEGGIFNRLAGSGRLLIQLALIFIMVMGLAVYYNSSLFSTWHFVTLVVVFGGIFLLLGLNQLKLVPPLVLAVFVLECLLLKMNLFYFAPGDAFQMPETVKKIYEDADHDSYRAMDITTASAIVLVSPNHPELDRIFDRMLASATTMPNLMWGLSSIDATISLPLARRELVRQLLIDEARGHSSTLPGSRLIDILSVRYLAFDNVVKTPSLDLIHADSENAIAMYRNSTARSKIQLYESAEANSTAEEVLIKLTASPSNILQVESDQLPSSHASEVTSGFGEATFDVIKSTAMKYEVEISADKPIWLFVADANYPGWEASVNGEETKLYSAQVLGKAVYVGSGKNSVIIEYIPRSFYLGLGISLVTAILMLLIWFVSLGINKRNSDLPTSES
ncbi:MAG: hypothetical protein ACJASL_000404 [Paraglaciecola sp.]